MVNSDHSSCPIPKGSENYGNRGTSWHTMIWISLASLALTTGISLSLIILHLRRYRASKEQRQIIRIVFSVVVYSLVAFFELVSYEGAQYLDPLGDVYEAFGLCALFLLFIQYAAPSGTFDHETFEAVRAAEEGDTLTTFNWPKISWIFVFQYPIVEIFCVIIQEATQATGHYCLNSLSPIFAHLWVELIESFSIGACIVAIWKFRQRMKRTMKVRRAMSKLLCFKLIVFIRFTQAWIFSLLLEYHAIKTSSSFSYNDILYGIPAVLTCVEMVLFAAGFWYAFSSTEYGTDAKPHVKRLSVWKAALDAMNPLDIIYGIARIFPLCVEMRKTGDWSAYRAATKEQGLQGAVRKGVRKYKAKKGAKNDNYSELDEDLESLHKPDPSHLSQDYPRYSMGGGAPGPDMYQPPSNSPPEEARSYLMGNMGASGHQRNTSGGYLAAEMPAPGRPRASSQSSLMPESEFSSNNPYLGAGGYSPGQRYDRSRSPSPSRFVEDRDMV